ncbi:MAG: polysaccharide deacetylase family protein [Bacteroidetes bacterium]|nr:MAG: polysaccharide deacetylase family protein [Bacteroidota bacterium]
MNTPVRIHAALLRHDAAWITLLQQTGVPWSVPDSDTALDPMEFSVIIANGTVRSADLTAYMHGGGAVLYTTASGIAIDQRCNRRLAVHALFPGSVPNARFHSVLDLHQRVMLFDEGTPATVDPIGRGYAGYLGIDVTALFADRSIVRRDFLADGERLPNERVARATKEPVRRIVHSLLEELHHRRGVPFLHAWYFPGGARSLFTFRVDSDRGTKEQVEEIRTLSDRYGVPATWFLDVKSHEPWLRHFSEFGRQETAVHCYEHEIFPGAARNAANFARAAKAMRQAGMSPAGVTAPTGEWNENIGRAVEQCGFTYSSEFGYDYDALPSYPLISGAPSAVLQLPIHPVCIGSMLRARMDDDAMFRYYLGVIDRKVAAAEPVCLYHHPTHRHNGVIERVFSYIQSLGLPMLSYRDYAGWWKARLGSIPEYRWDGANVLRTGPADEQHHVRISFPDGTESVVPASESIDTRVLTRNPVRTPAMASGAERTRQFSLRRHLQDILDWWIKATA